MARTVVSEEQKLRGKRLAQKIKASRENKFTQDELAQVAGVPIDTLRKLERGIVASPSVFLIADLANALKEDLKKWLK